MIEKYEACPKCGNSSEKDGFVYDGQVCAKCGWGFNEYAKMRRAATDDLYVALKRMIAWEDQAKQGVEYISVSQRREDLCYARYAIAKADGKKL